MLARMMAKDKPFALFGCSRQFARHTCVCLTTQNVLRCILPRMEVMINEEKVMRGPEITWAYYPRIAAHPTACTEAMLAATDSVLREDQSPRKCACRGFPQTRCGISS